MAEWKPAATAPYRKVIWVRNALMEKPVKATRGYVYNGAVHEDPRFFTTVYTADKYFPTPAGQLAIPDEWTESLDEPTTQGDR